MFSFQPCDSFGQPAWTLDTGNISLTVTRDGAQTAPVCFRHGGREVSPYYVSPWQGEGYDPGEAKVLGPLRGDFLCMPFGANPTPFRGEVHPPHGETSCEPWKLRGVARADAVTTLELRLETRARPGRVARVFQLVDGHPVVYSIARVSGFVGPSSFAHHAILAVPEQPGALLIGTSAFVFGLTAPHRSGEHQALAFDAEFADLAHVPAADGTLADCSVFPAREGHTDLLCLFERADHPPSRPAWVAAVNTVERWMWFAFKDPVQMPARIFWMENRGRPAAPWNGRNRCLGLEDGRTWFDCGLADSAAPNPLTARGVPTAWDFDGTDTEIRYLQGCVPVPDGFGRVQAVEFAKGYAIFTGACGQAISVPVAWDFVWGAEL
jgi:hypothetical protein